MWSTSAWWTHIFPSKERYVAIVQKQLNHVISCSQSMIHIHGQLKIWSIWLALCHKDQHNSQINKKCLYVRALEVRAPNSSESWTWTKTNSCHRFALASNCTYKTSLFKMHEYSLCHMSHSTAQARWRSNAFGGFECRVSYMQLHVHGPSSRNSALAYPIPIRNIPLQHGATQTPCIPAGGSQACNLARANQQVH